MRRSRSEMSTPPKGDRQSSRSFTARSPAAKELVNRAIYRSPRRMSKQQTPRFVPDASMNDSDMSNDSIMSERALREALKRNSWKSKMRSSDFHPTLETSNANDDSFLDTSRPAKNKKSRTSTISEIQLPPNSPQEKRVEEEFEKPDTPIKGRVRRQSRRNKDAALENSYQKDFDKSIQEIQRGENIPVRDSLTAFKKAGPVRHSDSEGSEPDIVRKKKHSGKSLENKEKSVVRLSIFSDKNSPSKTRIDSDSEVDTPVNIVRWRPKRSRKYDDKSMNLNLHLDQTKATHYSSEASSDSEVDFSRKKVVNKKKSIAPPVKISLSIREEEEDKDVDSEEEGPLIGKRPKRPNRVTRQNSPLNLSQNTPEKRTSTEKPASEIDSDQEVIGSRRVKKNTQKILSPVNEDRISLPQFSPERNMSEEKPESENESEEEDIGSQRVKKNTEKRVPRVNRDRVSLPQFSPERNMSEEKPESENESEEDIGSQRVKKNTEKREPRVNRDRVSLSPMTPDNKISSDKADSQDEESDSVNTKRPDRRNTKSLKKRNIQLPESSPENKSTAEDPDSDSGDQAVETKRPQKRPRISSPRADNVQLSPMTPENKQTLNSTYNAKEEPQIKTRQAARSLLGIESNKSLEVSLVRIDSSLVGENMSVGAISSHKKSVSRIVDANMTPVTQPEFNLSADHSLPTNVEEQNLQKTEKRITRSAKSLTESEISKLASSALNEEEETDDSPPVFERRPRPRPSRRTTTEIDLDLFSNITSVSSSQQAQSDSDVEVQRNKASPTKTPDKNTSIEMSKASPKKPSLEKRVPTTKISPRQSTNGNFVLQSQSSSQDPSEKHKGDDSDPEIDLTTKKVLPKKSIGAESLVLSLFSQGSERESSVDLPSENEDILANDVDKISRLSPNKNKETTPKKHSTSKSVGKQPSSYKHDKTVPEKSLQQKTGMAQQKPKTKDNIESQTTKKTSINKNGPVFSDGYSDDDIDLRSILSQGENNSISSTPLLQPEKDVREDLLKSVESQRNSTAKKNNNPTNESELVDDDMEISNYASSKESSKRTDKTVDMDITVANIDNARVPLRANTNLVDTPQKKNDGSSKTTSALHSKTRSTLPLSGDEDIPKEADNLEVSLNTSVGSAPDLQRIIREPRKKSKNVSITLDLLTPEKDPDDREISEVNKRSLQNQSPQRVLSITSSSQPATSEQIIALSSQKTHVSESPDVVENENEDFASSRSNSPIEDFYKVPRFFTSPLRKPPVQGKSNLESEVSGKTTKSSATFNKALLTSLSADTTENTKTSEPISATTSLEKSTRAKEGKRQSTDSQKESHREKQDERSSLDVNPVGDLNFENSSSSDSSGVSSIFGGKNVPEKTKKSNSDNGAAIQQEEPPAVSPYISDDSNVSESDTSIDFKRTKDRKRDSRKSSNRTAAELADFSLSFSETLQDKQISDQVSPVLQKRDRPSNVNKQKQADDKRKSSEETVQDLDLISLHPDGTDNSIISRTKESLNRDTLQDKNKSSLPPSKISEKGADGKKSSHAVPVHQNKTAFKDVERVDIPTPVSTTGRVKRNLHKSLTDAQQVETSKTANLEQFSRDDMTSTPINDVALTASEGVHAIGLLENNDRSEFEEDPDEDRMYTAEDFKAALAATKDPSFKKPYSKSNKMFTLADFGKLMTSVRSPSLIHSMRTSSVNQTKLYSLRDFERALTKMRNTTLHNRSTTDSFVRTMPSVDESEEGIMMDNDVIINPVGQHNAQIDKIQPVDRDETVEGSTYTESQSNLEGEVQDVEGMQLSGDKTTEAQVSTEQDQTKQSEKTIVEGTTQEENSEDLDGALLLSEEEKDETDKETSMEDVTEDKSGKDETEEDIPDKDETEEDIPDKNETEVEDSSDKDETEVETMAEKSATSNITKQKNDMFSVNPSDSDNSGHEGQDQDSGDEPSDRQGTYVESDRTQEEQEDLPSVVGYEKSQPAPDQASSASRALITSYFSASTSTPNRSTAPPMRPSLPDWSPPPQRKSAPTKKQTDFREILKNWPQITAAALERANKVRALEAARLAEKQKKLKEAEKQQAKEQRELKAKRNAKSAGGSIPLKSVNILKEIKQDWVNKRLIAKIKGNFAKEVPKVMNDFLRELASNVSLVMKADLKKKVPEDAVRRVIELLHKREIIENEHELYRFVNEYMPSTFERVAFAQFDFRKKYYKFK